MKKKMFMIGNAHLDPIWMWQWQEGCAEVKATFRSALDRMKEFSDFKFTCAAAVTYAWIEEIYPEMFEEIKQRVAEGRWILAGGWWVQPDCNQPSGESFVRHGLYSQRYFREKFGTDAKVGYNVDSFGHNWNIPQILKKSGMDAYVMMRPMEHEKHMPTLFNWQSPDGSTVPVFRIPFAYCCDYGTKEELLERIRGVSEVTNAESDSSMVFYGVGNHGGGPTKLNIGFIKELQEPLAAEGTQLIFAGPDDFFAQLAEDGTELPLHRDDLQHHASGCYSAVSAIKTANRKSETRLLAAEKFSVLADRVSGAKYPAESFKRAWLNTLFNQFHDSLGGCSIKPAYDDVLEFAGESLAIAARNQNTALQRLSWMIDTSDGEYAAIIVFNPHTWEVTGDVRVNSPCGRRLGRVEDADGNSVASQFVRSESESCWNSPDILFRACVPALGWKVYRAYPAEPETTENLLNVNDNCLENDRIRVVFDRSTGYITEMTDKITGNALLDGYGAVPVVIDETLHDTWSHGRNFFDKEIGCFGDATFEVLESGPVRGSLKVVSRYQNSTLTQIFSLRAGSDKLEANCTIDWQEKHRMLKLRYPAALSAPRAFYQIPYAQIERPCDGEEECGLQWIAVKGAERSLVMLNNNKYSFSIKENALNLTVVRSPLYADHGNVRTSMSPYTDLGEHSFAYAVFAAPADCSFGEIDRIAEEFNTPLTYINENNHQGCLPQSYTGASCDRANVLITAIKPAEDGSGYVIRAVETDGLAVEAQLDLPVLNTVEKVCFAPYEIKTLLITEDGAKEVDMTENH